VQVVDQVGYVLKQGCAVPMEVPMHRLGEMLRAQHLRLDGPDARGELDDRVLLLEMLHAPRQLGVLLLHAVNLVLELQHTMCRVSCRGATGLRRIDRALILLILEFLPQVLDRLLLQRHECLELHSRLAVLPKFRLQAPNTVIR